VAAEKKGTHLWGEGETYAMLHVLKSRDIMKAVDGHKLHNGVVGHNIGMSQKYICSF